VAIMVLDKRSDRRHFLLSTPVAQLYQRLDAGRGRGAGV
jgi:hypothetical protein